MKRQDAVPGAVIVVPRALKKSASEQWFHDNEVFYAWDCPYEFGSRSALDGFKEMTEAQRMRSLDWYGRPKPRCAREIVRFNRNDALIVLSVLPVVGNITWMHVIVQTPAEQRDPVSYNRLPPPTAPVFGWVWTSEDYDRDFVRVG